MKASSVSFLVGSLSLSLFSSAAVAAEKTIVCEALSCTATQPNGGILAQSLCDGFKGPFVFEMGPETEKYGSPGKITIKEYDDGAYAMPARFFTDKDGHVNIWDSKDLGSLQAFIPVTKPGTLIIQGNKGIIAFAKYDLRCSQK